LTLSRAARRPDSRLAATINAPPSHWFQRIASPAKKYEDTAATINSDSRSTMA
jgi:hypothetical protein